MVVKAYYVDKSQWPSMSMVSCRQLVSYTVYVCCKNCNKVLTYTCKTLTAAVTQPPCLTLGTEPSPEIANYTSVYSSLQAAYQSLCAPRQPAAILFGFTGTFGAEQQEAADHTGTS